MTMIRVADFIAQLLVEHGIRDCFMLTGGGAMQLNDALGRAAGLKSLFLHHEQAAAIAAESYARLSGRPAVLNVTCGPGGINTLNGVFGAYVDSIPMIVISGQVKRETYAPSYDLPLRQLGDQEVDIISMVRGITKFAAYLSRPEDARWVVEKALRLMTRGRPGPVWIDIPGDVQGAMVDPTALRHYDPTTDIEHTDESLNSSAELGALSGPALNQQVQTVLDELAQAERPLILVGAGVRISGQHASFIAFIDWLGVPVVTGWNAHDALHDDHPLFVGRPGSVGTRGGNFAVQTADYLLVLGSRLNIRQISYNWQSFARNARVAMVDIDAAELAKPTLKLHRAIHADLGDFIQSATQCSYTRAPRHGEFLSWCRTRNLHYPVVMPEYQNSNHISPYLFGEALFEALEADDIIVCGDGTACVTMFQVAKLKQGQRLYTNSGCASMGYDLPAAIGAYYANAAARRIICIAGDGSIMMNLQELQTIRGQNLPIKIFLLNNDGYHSIRQTQQNYFPDNIIGCGPDSGLTFPDFQKLSFGFDLKAHRVGTHADLRVAIIKALEIPGPYLCEVMIDKTQAFAPKLSSRKLDDGTMVTAELEDMAPFLPRDELIVAMTMPTAVN